MAEKVAKSHGDQNATRRMVKASQKAARRAAAHGKNNVKQNYRAGFKFALDPNARGGSNELIRKQELQNKIADSCRFGQLVNEQIHAWLDEVDGVGTVKIELGETPVQVMAFLELAQWLKKGLGKGRYGFQDGEKTMLIARHKEPKPVPKGKRAA